MPVKPQPALAQLQAIQTQLIRCEKVQCYRWATIGISSWVGLIPSWFQSAFVHSHPSRSGQGKFRFGDGLDSLPDLSASSLAIAIDGGRPFLFNFGFALPF